MKLLERSQPRVDAALTWVLDTLGEPRASDGPLGAHHVPGSLLDAMRYAVLSPGKRLRPALVFGSAQAVGHKMRDVLPAACAVEMIHAYSLVHDDLPALDDDDLRRGRATVHRAFDEATAVLAGDALLTEAFSLLADAPRIHPKACRARPRDRMRAVLELARAAGAGGMVGGQQDDVALAGKATCDTEVIRSIHLRKTGRLIQASTALGALWVGADEDKIDALRRFGSSIGYAFQLVDDALDGDGFATIEGIQGARKRAADETKKAIAQLADFEPELVAPLIELATAMVLREA